MAPSPAKSWKVANRNRNPKFQLEITRPIQIHSEFGIWSFEFGTFSEASSLELGVSGRWRSWDTEGVRPLEDLTPLGIVLCVQTDLRRSGFFLAGMLMV